MIAPTVRYDYAETGIEPSARRQVRDASQRVMQKRIMGARFNFCSSSKALLDLVETAYGEHAPHRFAQAGPTFEVELRLLPRRAAKGREPPSVQTQLERGVLYGVMDECNYVLMSPQRRWARIVVSEDMLGHAYHVRYELIEFAVFILAARYQGLVPLHAACVGDGGRGILLLGESGAGKSTLALHSLLHGLEFLAEDAVFVQPDSLLATGVANYLHVRPDVLDTVDDGEARRWIANSPVIQRRSGVEKLEVDLRRAPAACRLAGKPLQVVGAVMVSNRQADNPDALLTRVPREAVAACLSVDQTYAMEQPEWRRFERRMMSLPMYRLRRGREPRSSVDALRQLLD